MKGSCEGRNVMADVKKAAATAKPVAKAVAATKTAEAKVEPVKTEEVKTEAVKKETAKKAPAKKAAAKTEAKAPAKKATVKKAETKAPAKKTTAKKAAVKESVSIQFAGKEYKTDDFVKIAKDVWQYDLGGKVADFKSVELYVKPEEEVVYYVINGDVTGSFAI